MKNARFIRPGVLALLLGALAITGCKDDPPPAEPPPAPDKVVVVNEGLPASGTGSISLYDPLNKNITNNVFYKTNTYVPGNSLYSIYNDGDRSFLSVAGTGEVLMVNSGNMNLQERFTGFGAPHKVLKVSDNKYYVSDWIEGGVWVLNARTGSLVKSILTGNGPENMVKYGNLVFVTNSGGPLADSTVSVIHALADTLMFQLPTAHNPNSLLVDNQDKLWVLCSGIEDQQNPFNSTPGALIKYDLTRDSLEFYVADSLTLDTFWVFTDNQLKPQDLIQGGNANTFYFLDYYKEANLMRFDRNNNALPTVPLIMGSYNAVGFDPDEKDIYLSDPGDGTSPGVMYRFDEAGGQQDAQMTGIAPVDFGFR